MPVLLISGVGQGSRNHHFASLLLIGGCLFCKKITYGSFFPQRNPHASHKVRVESSSNTCCWVTHSARLGEEQVQFLAHPRQRSDRHLTKAGPVCGNLFLITPKPWFHIIKMMRVHLISFPTALMTNSFHCYLPTSFKIVMPSDVQDMYLFYI